MNRSSEQARRAFLKASLALSAAGLAMGSGFISMARSASASLSELTATQAVSAMRNAEISAETYATALLDRAAALTSLNAFRALDRDQVLEGARAADRRRVAGEPLGALHGLPIAVKDSVNTKDLPTTSGTKALRNFRPKNDALVLQPLFSAGAILMGKTNLHELSYGWTSNNAFTGAVHNPYDRTRVPGGSSGGSAAVVAARIAPLSVGTDTFGSVRVPATMCGICAIRPSFGRYPTGGVMGITPDFLDTPGTLARSVADLALSDSVITNDYTPLRARPLQGVRIGVAAEYYLRELDPEVERIVGQTLNKLQAAGAVLVWAELPEPANGAMMDGFFTQAADAVPHMSKYLDSYETGVTFEQLLDAMSPGIRWVFDNYSLPGAPNFPSPDQAAAAKAHIAAVRDAMRTYFRNHQVDAIAFPPVLMPAPLIGQDAEIQIGSKKLPIWYAMAHNIAVGSCAGLPGLVLPAGMTSSGLPVGVEFDGPPGNDRQLLALGLSLEKALGPIPAPSLRI